MNAAAITTEHNPDPPTQRRLYRRAVSLLGLTLYRTAHRTTEAAAGAVTHIAGRLLGFISWARRETAVSARLVVRVFGVVVWVGLEAVKVARVVPVVARVVPRRMGGMGA